MALPAGSFPGLKSVDRAGAARDWRRFFERLYRRKPSFAKASAWQAEITEDWIPELSVFSAASCVGPKSHRRTASFFQIVSDAISTNGVLTIMKLDKGGKSHLDFNARYVREFENSKRFGGRFVPIRRNPEVLNGRWK